MIGWISDRLWARKNQAALQQLDEQSAWLAAEGERLDRRLVEMFGPDWKREAEERLSRLTSCRWSAE